MSKKMCKEKKILNSQTKGKHPKYICKKCGEESVKEKWVCKPTVL